MRSEQHRPTRVRLNIVRVTDPTILQRIYQFRVQVWSTVPGVQPDTFPEGTWQDAHDAHARHWAIFDENDIVARPGCVSIEIWVTFLMPICSGI